MKSYAARRRSPVPVLVTALKTENDVFDLRRQAKTLTDAVGLDSRDQVRLATAVSELGRDLLRSAPMTAGFSVQQEPPVLLTVLQWNDDRAPSPESLTAVTRLLPQTRYEPASPATGYPGAAHGSSRIEIGCPIPQHRAGDLKVEQLRDLLKSASPASAIDDLRAQTRDLLASLQEAHAQRDELERLNEELTETNAGVMAMYAELTVEHHDVVERFSQEHELALALQRSFLPATLPHVEGTELAVRYLPAATIAEIGGDFYEAVTTSRGLLLAVGDVVGHSLQAATVMGELRHALRAYAAEDHLPHVMLQNLDHLLRLHHPGWTATVCIVLIEPDNRRLHIANAGHLPPLLLAKDGTTRYLTDHGPLLGVGLPQPPSTEHLIDTDSRLVLITDGLIETRDCDINERLALMAATAAAGPQQPDALCTAMLDTFGSEPEDDIIVFTARLSPPQPT